MDRIAYNPNKPFIYTYYGPSPGRGKKKPVVKIYRGSNIGEISANVARWMTRTARGMAVVGEVHDEEYGELLLVASYFPGEKFQIIFEQDTTKRVFITKLTEDDLKLLAPVKP
jgi:hypothetical protein